MRSVWRRFRSTSASQDDDDNDDGYRRHHQIITITPNQQTIRHISPVPKHIYDIAYQASMREAVKILSHSFGWLAATHRHIVCVFVVLTVVCFVMRVARCPHCAECCRQQNVGMYRVRYAIQYAFLCVCCQTVYAKLDTIESNK